MTKLKHIQRLSKREGWYDNLTGMLFSLSSVAAGDDPDLEVLERMKLETDSQMEAEKQDLLRLG